MDKLIIIHNQRIQNKLKEMKIQLLHKIWKTVETEKLE
jgi:hypothetical protein